MKKRKPLVSITGSGKIKFCLHKNAYLELATILTNAADMDALIEHKLSDAESLRQHLRTSFAVELLHKRNFSFPQAENCFSLPRSQALCLMAVLWHAPDPKLYPSIFNLRNQLHQTLS